MKSIFTKLVAALTLGAATIAVSVPAEARDRWGYSRDHGRWDGGRSWRGDRGRGDRWDRGYRGGHGYYAPRGRYYAPRYYGHGYGYGHPRHRHYYRDHDGDALIGALAGIAIGAAIASSNDY